MKNQSKLITMVAVISLLVGSSTGFLGGFLAAKLANNDDDNSNLSEVITQDVQVIDEESSVIDVAEKSSNSVVSIVITEEVPIYEEVDPFEYFFNENLQREQIGSEEVKVGSGSGFIITEDGMVITNKHVVTSEDASYTVILNNGDKYDATVLERDTLLDIAFMKIDSEDTFEPLPLGTSTDLKTGQRVVAIGNALGEFSNTVSTGIISGVSRNITATDSFGRDVSQIEDVIQTDASINPGNSGGPLLDINGNVIGVNVAVASNAENIGFAIKIDTVKDLLERYEETGSIERPVLGVRYRLITPEVAKTDDLVVDYGALIVGSNRASEQAIVPGSAAERAGFKIGDILLEIDGTNIDEENSLYELIQNKYIGDEVTIKYLRDGEELEVKVVLQSTKTTEE